MSGADAGAHDAEAALEQARQLDAQAMQQGEETAAGRALRAQAAALRMSAIGPRSYPVVACASCYRITGWVDSDNRCDFCARRAGGDVGGAGGWQVAPAVPRTASAPRPSLGTRLAQRLGTKAAGAQVVSVWMEHVDPGVTGPIEPEDDYRTEVALRDEVARVDAAGMLVRFTTAEHRFDGSRWERSAITHITRTEMPNPSEFAASLPVETLVEAWSDYQQAVVAFNRRSWSAESVRRDAAIAAKEASETALREQAHAADFLHE